MGVLGLADDMVHYGNLSPQDSSLFVFDTQRGKKKTCFTYSFKVVALVDLLP